MAWFHFKSIKGYLYKRTWENICGQDLFRFYPLVRQTCRRLSGIRACQCFCRKNGTRSLKLSFCQQARTLTPRPAILPQLEAWANTICQRRQDKCWTCRWACSLFRQGVAVGRSSRGGGHSKGALIVEWSAWNSRTCKMEGSGRGV